MNDEDRRRLFEQLGFNRIPIATTGYVAPTQPTIGLEQATTDYGTGTQTWEEILNPQGVQTQEQNRLQALGFGDPLATITDDPTAIPRVDPTYALPANTQQYDMSRWDMLPDPTTAGTYSVMPNMGTDQPLTTGLIPASATTPVQDAGMAEVELPFFERFPLAEQGMDQGTFDALEHIDAIYGSKTTESTLT